VARKVAFIFMVLGFALLLAPKLRFKFDSGPAKNDRVAFEWILPIPLRLNTLNSQKVTSVVEKTLMLVMFGRLVKNGEQLQIEPDMLSKWSYGLGERKLRLSVRPGVFFHNGVPLGARDIVFSIHEWARPENLDHELLEPIKGVLAYTRGISKGIAGIKILDPMTIEVELEQWGAETLIKNLANPRFCVYLDNFGGLSADEYFKAPVGTGPYKVISYRPEESVFDANKNYYLGSPITQRIRLLYIPPNRAVQAFRERRVDNLILYHIPQPQQLEGPDVVIRRFSGANTLSLFFNTEFPALKNEKLRRAIAARVVKEKLAQRCFPGAAVATHFIPPGLMGSTPIPDGGELSSPIKMVAPGDVIFPPLTLYMASDENGDCNREVLNQQFKGTSVVAEVRPFQELFDRLVSHRLNIWLESSEFRTDDPMQNLHYFSSQSDEFLLGTPVPWLESKFRKLDGPLLVEERADIYRTIDNYLVEHTHVFPILYFSNYVVYRKRVSGLEFLRTARLATRWHLIRVGQGGDSGA
jgi:ABC-type transport system substrate-binding protein